MWPNAQWTLSGSCQLARVTRDSSVGGNPVILSTGRTVRGAYDLRMDEGPVSASAQVSAATWLEAPLTRWSMWNVGQLVPTRKVSRGNGPVMALPQMTAPPDLG